MAEIESPCNKVCVFEPDAARCIGCGRSLAEISGWIGLSPDERRRIMTELPQRLAVLVRARAARADLT